MRWLVRRLRDAYEPGDNNPPIIPTDAELDAWTRVEPRIERRLMVQSTLGLAAGSVIGGLLVAIANPSGWHTLRSAWLLMFLPLALMWFFVMMTQSHAARDEFIRSHRLREAMRGEDDTDTR